MFSVFLNFVVQVNIFGGIVNCATIANGIINACRNIQLRIPLVVRLEGTRLCLHSYSSNKKKM